MAGITDINVLISRMQPSLRDGEYVFATVPGGSYGDHVGLNPIAVFKEDEGLTLVVPAERAATTDLRTEGVYRMITLCVHSSLEAVGLTAAVANALTDRGISANVIAAFHHDHVFVPVGRAEEALAILRELSSQSM